MAQPISRRRFMAATTAASLFQVVPRDILGGDGYTAANDRLNIAGIGVGGMGATDLRQCESENIVALCDVDHNYAAETFARYSSARVYTDYRKMLEERKDIDAVVVATPDHTHAVIGMAVMEAGKHLRLQKPLAHSLWETRQLRDAARRSGVQTQMGNQGHSSESMRLLKEWLDDGAIGPVEAVHAWTDRPVGGDPWSTFDVKAKPAETPPVPEKLDWDLWLGPAPYRAYHPDYHPSKWRGWLDFGTGALGDMGCHILDPAFWALELGAPDTVQASTTHWREEVSSQTFPRASIVRYEFPARGEKPPVKLTWYDGRLKPPIPDALGPGRELPDSGALLIGRDGVMMHYSHGAGGLRIAPESKMRSYERPPKTLPRVPGGSDGHTKDWIRACKDGRPASSDFEYGAALTEMVLLGVVAIRAKDEKLRWDSENFVFAHNDQANALLRDEYRPGWRL